MAIIDEDHKPKNFSEIISWWPSSRALADELGIPDAIVRQWKLRDSIPAPFWIALCETPIAERRYLTVRMLALLVDYRERPRVPGPGDTKAPDFRISRRNAVGEMKALIKEVKARTGNPDFRISLVAAKPGAGKTKTMAFETVAEWLRQIDTTGIELLAKFLQGRKAKLQHRKTELHPKTQMSSLPKARKVVEGERKD